MTIDDQMDEIAAALDARRHEQGLTLAEVADRSGCHRQHVWYGLAGKRRPTLRTLLRLVNAMGGRVVIEWKDHDVSS
jgi:transcriptional regulator with XRE-family HTH domain